ncbi:hypothetical protein JTB14_038291 [Gonioctena quinquepunctata]|nr:hypothetical protein JTB14_038291 [Gonioctena quinquepunctata]
MKLPNCQPTGSVSDNPFSKSGPIPRSPSHSVSPIGVTSKKIAKNPKETVGVTATAKTPYGRCEELVELKKQNNINEENKVHYSEFTKERPRQMHEALIICHLGTYLLGVANRTDCYVFYRLLRKDKMAIQENCN